MIQSEQPLADLIRIILVFIPGSLILGVVALVLIAYFKAYRSDKFKNARSGLLPKHVFLISISYSLLIIDEMLVVFERTGQGVSYHTILLVPACIAGVWAMWLVLTYERRRYSLNKTINADMGDLDDPSLIVKNQLPDGER